MNRQINFRPGYDKRSEGYGIHSLEINFILKGELGAVQLVVATGMYPESVSKQGDYMAMDLGYHSPKPMYEDHSVACENCEHIGGTCYYDGSTLNAEPVAEILITEGEDALWKRLEDYYSETFGDLK